MRGKTTLGLCTSISCKAQIVCRHFHEYGIFMNRMNPLYGDPSEFVVTKITHRILQKMRLWNRQSGKWKKLWKTGIRAEFLTVRSGKRSERRFSFIYPYQYLEDLPVKVSVSELKKLPQWTGSWRDGGLWDGRRNSADSSSVYRGEKRKVIQEHFAERLIIGWWSAWITDMPEARRKSAVSWEWGDNKKMERKEFDLSG